MATKNPKRQAVAKAARPLAVIILAAGAGKRMKSALPKVLQELAGKPLLQHVLETARTLEPAAIHVVYGHGGEAVRRAFAQQQVSWVEQAEQLAVLMSPCMVTMSSKRTVG